MQGAIGIEAQAKQGLQKSVAFQPQGNRHSHGCSIPWAGQEFQGNNWEEDTFEHQSEEPPLLSRGRTETEWRRPASTQHPFDDSAIWSLSGHSMKIGRWKRNGFLGKEGSWSLQISQHFRSLGGFYSMYDLLFLLKKI